MNIVSNKIKWYQLIKVLCLVNHKNLRNIVKDLQSSKQVFIHLLNISLKSVVWIITTTDLN